MRAAGVGGSSSPGRRVLIASLLLGAAAAACGQATPAATPPDRVAPTRSLLPAAAASARPAQGPGPSAAGAPQAVAQVLVRPLQARLVPDVLVTSTSPLTAAQIAAAERDAHATSALAIALGSVRLAHGVTLAIAVDPSSFRAYAPKGTAESDPLWESVARGNMAVAHAVARALAVPLGGHAQLARAGASPPDLPALRVGAYATVGLPGVGVMVDQAVGAALGLASQTGLLLVSGTDPVVAAAEIHQDLGAAVQAVALTVPITANGRLAWVPPAIGPITQGFGPNRNPFTGKPGFHPGIDIGAPLGAPIYAAAAGTVLYAGTAPGFGQEIILDNGGGVQTVYGHMERILVTSGVVGAGQPIALVGSEGESTGPHLHFEVHLNDRLIDPLGWLRAHGVRVTPS